MALFEFPVRVYWEDTDAGGIVYHANYLKFFERARTEWLRALGINQNALREQTGGVFVASDLSIEYLRPARLDDELLVTAAARSTGQASLVIAQQALRKMRDPSPPELLCEASVRIGWVNAATLKPTRLPSHVLEKFRP
ncbi:MAG: tol-pal system-associated acyl-CoA thioesterase [Burkholderiaceae bacterium]|nr:MAG: tol-pal system-associated acyl-CoA thioesterase [Burkholderiaceae bacterium]